MNFSLSRWFAIPALLLTITAARAGDGWVEDFEKAKAAAAKDHRDLFMEFTDSDSCEACIQFHREVLSKDAFKMEASKNFVLLELDFPKKKEQPPEIKAQNEKLGKLYAVEKYPTVLLADAGGRPYAVIGYEEKEGTAGYLERLTELHKIREGRDENLKKAAAAEGVDKAKLILAALDPMDANIVRDYYQKEIAEAIAADKDDVSGVKLSSKVAALDDELAALHAAKKFKEFKERIDKFIADEKLTGMKKQEMLLNKLAAFEDDTKAVLQFLDEVIAVDPESEMAKQAKMIKEEVEQAEKEQKKDAEPEPKPAAKKNGKK